MEFANLQNGEIQISDIIEHGQGENPPITLGVERQEPAPDTKHVPLLTVLYTPDGKAFRVAAMVLDPSAGLDGLVVRWWALAAV